jgi:hypothetical protein
MAEEASSMSAERFAALMAAHGVDVSSWPAPEQAEGAAFASTEQGRHLLARARDLDALLGAHAVPAPPPALHARIVADGKAVLVRRRRTFFWWSSLGLAGVGFAGALAGAVLVTVLTPAPGPDRFVLDAGNTAFGDVASSRDSEEDL